MIHVSTLSAALVDLGDVAECGSFSELMTTYVILPLCIHLKFEAATWKVHEQLDPGVCHCFRFSERGH